MRRILVVEDDPDLREVLAYELARDGFGVEQAALGKEALRSCRRSPPDLVLLDVMLPDHSGIEICLALRRSRETQGVPIIFLTACGADSDRIRGLEVGADDYLSKPFNMRELMLRIHSLLKRAESPAHAPISPERVFRREQLRVWQGFGANHMGRAEWREAREIWRAIRKRFESDLSVAELAGVEAMIAECDHALATGPLS